MFANLPDKHLKHLHYGKLKESIGNSWEIGAADNCVTGSDFCVYIFPLTQILILRGRVDRG